MKNFLLVVAMVLRLGAAFGQKTAEDYYNKGMDKAQAGELDAAIELLSKSIELDSEIYITWYNRGIAKSMLGLDKEAIADYDQVIKLQPAWKKVYLNRGTSRKRLTDYEGALADYAKAIELDSAYVDAYYNIGLTYEILADKEKACANFEKAAEYGSTEKSLQNKIENCGSTEPPVIKVTPIVRLTKKGDKTYGYSEKNPIKVGTGPDGGPANQRAYLALLRDAKGRNVSYERVRSCCPYSSENGLLGMAMVDEYQIEYLDKKGKKQKTSVYISFYDYEEPMILDGFDTVKP